METKKTAAQTSEKTAERWVKVQIQISTGLWIGYVRCPSQQRLLDVLNGSRAGELRANEEFFPVSEAKMRSPDGREVAAQSTYVNKASILFVGETENEGSRGIGGQAGHKPYPYVPKSTIPVRVYMPSFTLTGQVHCAKGQSVSDVLKSERRFITLTNVDIYPSAGGSEPGVSFLAVNKGQIISLEELN